jgi:HAE1 family hydrophobic/amphiphilic exporter-1
VVGFSLLSYVRTSYNGFFWVSLKPWDERKSRAEQYQAIKARLNQELKNLPAGTVFSFSPPAIPGVGTSGGVSFVLEDRAGRDVPFLATNLAKFLAAARKRPEIGSIFTTFIPSVPQEFIHVDKEKVLKQGVALSDVYNTIQANMGGLFVNYYNEFGRTWQVYIESEAPYRSNTNNLGQFYVRNNQGETVPLSALASFETRSGPEFTMRYNEYRSAQINASAAPGYSADQARTALEDIFKQTMPHEIGFDYMGMSYQEQKAEEGVPSSVIFGFSLLFVFLILAALYESWSLPFSVLLSTPVAVFGAFGVLWLRRVMLGLFLPPYMVQMENDVYADRQQIGALRSAALIVRFTAAVVVLHGMEILLWACFYRWQCLPSWDSAIYFSASSSSTLGCNDVSLPSNWRTLGPLESIIGVLMCGISVSLLFAIVTRLTSRNARLSRKEHRTTRHRCPDWRDSS